MDLALSVGHWYVLRPSAQNDPKTDAQEQKRARR